MAESTESGNIISEFTIMSSMNDENVPSGMLELNEELVECKEKLLRSQEALTRLERLYTITHSYTVELRGKLEALTAQLLAQQNNQTNRLARLSDTIDASTQYNEEETKLLGIRVNS